MGHGYKACEELRSAIQNLPFTKYMIDTLFYIIGGQQIREQILDDRSQLYLVCVMYGLREIHIGR